jgi:hypothetical protein
MGDSGSGGLGITDLGPGLWVLAKRLERGTYWWPSPEQTEGKELQLRPEAGEKSAISYTILATCRIHCIEPRAGRRQRMGAAARHL